MPDNEYVKTVFLVAGGLIALGFFAGIVCLVSFMLAGWFDRKLSARAETIRNYAVKISVVLVIFPVALLILLNLIILFF